MIWMIARGRHGDAYEAARRAWGRSAIGICAAIGSGFLFAPSLRAEDAASPASGAACTLKAGPTRTVVKIIDAETLLLDDNRQLRLIGALAPRSDDANAPADAWPAQIAAHRLLTSLVLGRTVRLAFGGRRFDRYGRYLAHVFLKDGTERGGELWVQGEMLFQGAARAYGLPGSFDCAAELAAHERMARSKRNGIWTIGIYQPIPALATRWLMQLRSRFSIVRGLVRDVARTKSAVYLNFGEDWKTDFTARIGKDVLSAHPTFDAGLDRLKGQEIEVRGWIERRNGPLIDVADPAQISPSDRQDRQTPVAGGQTRDSAVKPAHVPSDPPDGDDGTPADAPLLRDGSPSEAPTTAPQHKEKRPDDPRGKPPGAINL